MDAPRGGGLFAVAALAVVSGAITGNPVGGLVLGWLVAVCTTAGWLLILPRYWVSMELVPGPPPAVRITGIHRSVANAMTRA